MNNIGNRNDSTPVKPLFALHTVVRRYLLIFYWCKLWKWHKWTSTVEKGIKPTQEQLNAGVIGFAEYAKMYCDRCGQISKLSNELICKYKNSDLK